MALNKLVSTFTKNYHCHRRGQALSPPQFSEQIYGLEINPYAHELAQITVWIGYIQWRYENGFEQLADPILKPLNNIKRMDAILGYDEQGNVIEPDWEAVDVIIGNPPFLGGSKLRAELGDKYADDLFKLYKNRLPVTDLVCYWFEKARAMIEQQRVKRAGLLATQGIRGGANRQVLERIKASGDIFMAWSDRKWILDGAMVQVSMIGFDDGSQPKRTLDGKAVIYINADLSNGQLDLTQAKILLENSNLAFRGNQKGGSFDIPDELAQKFLKSNNPQCHDNREVIKRWLNGYDITHNDRKMWLIDFGINRTLAEAQGYDAPFNYIKEHVYPERSDKNKWWLHERTRPEMRAAIATLSRYIVTPHTSKHRFFVWLDNTTLPDHGLVVFARADDYFLGVLHSKVHELWTRRTGTQLRDAASGFRYTPTTCFETFPLPYPPGHEPREDETIRNVAMWAKRLVDFRDTWLNPPKNSVDIGQEMRKYRTLTNLYNALTYYQAEVKRKHADNSQWAMGLSQTIRFGDKVRPEKVISLEEIESLDYIQTQLDQAVLAAYRWPPALTDEQILARLLQLNLQRAALVDSHNA